MNPVLWKSVLMFAAEVQILIPVRNRKHRMESFVGMAVFPGSRYIFMHKIEKYSPEVLERCMERRLQISMIQR